MFSPSSLVGLLFNRVKSHVVATNFQVAGQKVVSRDPATNEALREFDCASEQAVLEVVGRAKRAQPGWAKLGVKKRVSVLRNFQRLLQENKAEVAELISRETGKPYVEALTTEIIVVLDSVRFLAENAFALLGDERLPHGNIAMKTKSGRILREPHGVIGIISPWNYPFSIPATESLSALAAGNAVVLKPSEFTTLVALKLAELFHSAGVPEEAFHVVAGDGSTGEALMKSGLDKLLFTGSVATGKRIAQAAATRLLPIVLELGGKDPMIVLEDADIDVASSGALWGAFVNAGQTCLSVERCYVDRKIYQPFLEACSLKTKQLRVGKGMDSEADIGPMIHERQLRVVEQHVENARRLGARILTGGKRLPELGPNFYAPTVIADVTHDMQIMREETFGPVLPIMAFDSEDEAVRLANDSEYGLSASIWTKDRRRGEALVPRINAGIVMVNDAVSCFGISEAPHGGVKSSGIGRAHGRFGLEEMVRIKYVASDRLPDMKKIWWYRYGEGFTRQMEDMLDLQFASRITQRIQGVFGSARNFFSKRL